MKVHAVVVKLGHTPSSISFQIIKLQASSSRPHSFESLLPLSSSAHLRYRPRHVPAANPQTGPVPGDLGPGRAARVREHASTCLQ